MNAERSEKALLLGRLRGQRQHVLEQMDGLTEAQLRTPVLPSGWTCLGLVRHLTVSDERYWFETVMAGGPLDYWPDGPSGDWRVGAEESAERVLHDYRAAANWTDTFIEGNPLSAAPLRPEPWWASAGLAFPDLRSVLVHHLVETATHAGHLDAARELLDGKQYLVID